MTLCHCDGPPHSYDPSWCGAGKGDNGQAIAQPRGANLTINIIVRGGKS